MADIVRAWARIRNGEHEGLLPSGVVEETCRGMGVVFRERVFTPWVTVRLFLLQILTGNTSITHLRQLAGFDFAASSFCCARMRLPFRLLRALLVWTIEQSRRADVQAIGQRIFLVDGSSYSMPDTPSLREWFGLPRGNRIVEGVAYPLCKFVGLIDLTTGMFVDCVCGTVFGHEMGLVARLHPSLRNGDILLGDRAFCSFAHVAMLNARGVLACFRLHQIRKVKSGARSQRWQKPQACPKWLARGVFDTMPAFLDVRIVTFHSARRGYRVKLIHIATTLPDDGVWTDAKVAELYGHRWKIETCFGHLKTTMKGDVLKCQTVGGIVREQLMYLLAYNLVRLSMLRYALREGVSVWRVSFVDALRQLASRLLGLSGVPDLLLVPPRPGRYQPRVRRRRMKEYDLLTVPREIRKQQEKQGRNA